MLDALLASVTKTMKDLIFYQVRLSHAVPSTAVKPSRKGQMRRV